MVVRIDVLHTLQMTRKEIDDVSFSLIAVGKLDLARSFLAFIVPEDKIEIAIVNTQKTIFETAASEAFGNESEDETCNDIDEPAPPKFEPEPK